jgi:hypothetical protein
MPDIKARNISEIVFTGSGGSPYTLPPEGRTVTESAEMLAVEGRALSGKLRRDLQAVKRKWDIQYKDIGLDILTPLVSWVNRNIDKEVEMKITYDAVWSTSLNKTYTVLLSPAAYGTRVLAPPFGGGRGMYDGITLTVSEV